MHSSSNSSHNANPHALLTQFKGRVCNQLYSRILPFWYGPALDREHGGWVAWLSNDLQPDHAKPKGLIINTRLLWTFSAVYLATPQPVYKQMAERAFDFVLNRFWDNQFGGAFWQLDRLGTVIDGSKKTYGQAFCIYALAEFERAFGSQLAHTRAIELFDLLEAHAYDPAHGGYIEVCNRDWTEAGPGARLSEKDMAEKKSMNCHLHMLEALTNLYQVWPDARVEATLRELLGLFENRILDRATCHLNHFFNETWQVRSDTYTFGHDIEASWLLCEAAETLGDEALGSRTRAVALRMAETTLNEGVASDGGLCYAGKAGKVIDPGKEWWPQAEALVGFVNAYQLSGESRYLDAALKIWDFIEAKLVDWTHGEWFWRVGEDGEPDHTLPKVSEWKDPYHAVRACLETLRRLESVSVSLT